MRLRCANRFWHLAVCLAVLIIPGGLQAQWVAFLDHARGPGTSNNVTVVDLAADSGGKLTNVLGGQVLSAGFAVSRSASLNYAGAMSTPAAGTPAHEVFNGLVDFANAASGNSVLLPSAAPLALTFTNLDPAKRYSFIGTAVRGDLYPLRWTVCTLQGAAGFKDAHSGGCLTNGDPRVPAGTLTAGQAALNTGSNSLAGDILRWLDIDPGADGQFSVEMAQWLGAIPNGTAGDNYSYVLSAMRLEEFPTGNAGPGIAITSPANDSAFPVNANFAITAEASGTITNVSFYADGALVGSAAASPFSVNTSISIAGIYQLTAVATDNAGMTATSAPVRVAVLPPGNWVGPSGYSNAFTTMPTAAEWSTRNNGGTPANITTVAGLDAAAGTNIASLITTALMSGGANPGQNALAMWSSSGYLHLSPATIAYSLLMGTFVNNTGTNANAIRIRYLYTTNNTTGESVQGLRAYYSLSGAAGSWTVIPPLCSRPGGILDTTVTLPSPWAYGSRLYLLWADENSSSGDMINQIDNFTLDAVVIPPATYTAQAPALDGVADLVWNAAPVFTLSNAPVGPTNLTGPDDLSATWRCLWDATNFYLLVSVTDSSSINDSTNPWDDDALEIFIDADNSKSVAYGADDFQYVFGWNDPGFTETKRAPASTNGVAFAQTTTAGGYVMEIKFPWATLGTTPAVGNRLGLEVQAADDDNGGGRDSKLTWWVRAGDAASSNPSLFGVVELVSNTPPFSITIISPANNATLGVPASIGIQANVTGQATNVQFYVDGALLGAVTSSPFMVSWATAGTGGHQLFAVARGPSGSVTSAVVNVTLTPNTAPSIAIASPTNTAAFLAPTNIAISVTATDADGWVTNVQFRVNGVAIGDASTSPFGFTWTNAAVGSNQLVAVATDNGGLSRTSAPVSIVVALPPFAVTLVSPAPNATFGTNQTVPFAASATGLGITGLGFYVRDTLLFGDVSAPYSNQFALPENVYWVYAVATNNLGQTAFSGTNLFTVLNQPAGIVYYGGDYAENFDGMGPAGAITPVGWFVGAAPGAQGAVGLTNVIPSDGSVSSPTNWNLGVSGDADRALGSQAGSAAGGDLAMDLRIHNFTSSNIVSFSLTYDGEQWRAGGSSAATEFPQYLVLYYSTNGFDFAPLPPSFTFTSRVDSGVGALNGNLAANRTAGLGGIYTPDEPIPPGMIFHLRWHDINNSGQDHILAIDNVTFAATTLAAVGLVCNLTTPTNQAVFEAPDDILLTAQAAGGATVTNVIFFTNQVELGRLSAAPFTWVWSNAPVGSHALQAMAFDDAGAAATSKVVNITVTPPVTNTIAPVIAGVVPAPGERLSQLTTIQVIFSERVTNVNASDLLINGEAALSVTGAGSNYTFTVPPPALGLVSVTWAAGHGILDLGRPPLPFDGQAPGASWTYTLVDGIPPTIYLRNPPADATVSNLTQIQVVFSEPVLNVDAADLLINGAPAIGMLGSGSNYTFGFPQPAGGTVSVAWSAGHGITDVSGTPFDGAAATWSYTLQMPRVTLIASNSVWRYAKATNEASSPTPAWRGLSFNDSSWPSGPAAFYYGPDPYTGTLLNDMSNNYSGLYLRQRFLVENPANLTNVLLRLQADDGAVVWINGTEVARLRVGAGEIPYNGLATSSGPEFPSGACAVYSNLALANPPVYLVAGTNVLAIHALNNSLANSSDFGVDAELTAEISDPNALPPTILVIHPPAGQVFGLSNLTVTFSKPVTGVNAEDLLINGVPATGLAGFGAAWTFSFAQPAYGTVSIAWANGHGITDTNSPALSFNASNPGAVWQYSLLNPSAPLVGSQNPGAGATVNTLTQIQVTFTEPVMGVDAADLLINGAGATGVSGSNATYTFTFPQPAYGNVSIGWSASHGIHDLEEPANAFDYSRPGSTWTYSLVDQTAPFIAAQQPPAGAHVTNLTQILVIFSEPVAGVKAADLLINGSPATGVSGGGTTYAFTFAQPNATVVAVQWAGNHSIRDLAPIPNAFNAAGPGAVWAYTTLDNVAPTVASLNPPPNATVRTLTQITVTFTEAVVGLEADDLLVNGRPAASVSGTGPGPYVFQFPTPANGMVEVSWAPGHDIRDLANPSNPLADGEWAYRLDPEANFADMIVINEIMFNPPGGAAGQEWIELHNLAAYPVNLNGWRFGRGIRFNFPNVTIPAGGFLVVAADVAAFQSVPAYAGISNVVGGWTGTLANSDETIELETALGEKVDEVHYASEGDWARRERGRGADLVSAITRNGNTATVTVFGHGYTYGDQVVISGADQPEYNGLFTITQNPPPASTFTITVPGSPVSPATGHIICRQVMDNNFSGWSWVCDADGLGSSLELVNPSRPNNRGQNWLSSSHLLGTPGRPNSVFSTNVAPFIEDVAHFPPVPRSTDPVAITARVSDEWTNGVASVTLFYRNHTANYGGSPPAFNTMPMRDDGTQSDGLAGDGLYGAVLAAAPNGTIIEFYVRAVDTEGRARTWPAPAWNTNHLEGQVANALYQVDNEVITNLMPAIRVVMTGSERAIFPPSSTGSDAEMNVTMISQDGEGTKVRYNCGVRIRGAGSRSRTPKNNRVNIPNDNRWNKLAAINLNCQFVHAQLMGAAVAQRAGLPAADAQVVQYRVNGVNLAPVTAPVNGTSSGAGWGAFLLVEPVNGDLAADLFPADPDGNVYRASIAPHVADLTYQGTDPSSYLTRGYFKTSNQGENDWTDLQSLTYAFSQVASAADYLQAIRTNVNVQLWMRYFAVGTLLNYGETSMFNGRGDDYALYRGMNDPRFVLIGHDFDTVFGQGDTTNTSNYAVDPATSIWMMLNPPNVGVNAPNVPVLRRFMTNAAFAPLYFAELKRLCDTTFHPAQLNPLFDQLLTGWGVGPDANTIANMKNFANLRRASVLSQIPLTLTAGHNLGLQSGYPYTTSASVTLFGSAHAIDTRKVLVNGAPAAWSAWEARWTNNVILQPGINQVLVQALNSNDVELARATVNIWFNNGGGQSVSGAIATDTAWNAAGGPYTVTGNLTVNNGAKLTIQPGTTVYLNAGVNLTVANGGALLAEGTATAPIRFSRAPGSGASWGGLTINGGIGSPESRLTHAHIEFNGATAIHVNGGTVFLSHLTFGNNTVQYLSLDNASFVVGDCVFPSAAAGAFFELVHGKGGVKAGGRGVFIRNFFGAANSQSGNYNDVVDFSGGHRPAPIVQFINNVFAGTGDDHLDLDNTDAWIEGNIFLHAHKNGSPDTSSAISGGNDTGEPSEITIVGNIFYDCDHTVLAKQGNFYTLINNTVVRQTIQGGQETEGAVVCLADNNMTEGAGVYLEGNILYDLEQLVQNHTNALVTFTNNLMALPWTGPGGGNATNDPLFQYVPQPAETTNFTDWAQAQVMRQWFGLRTGSPAAGAGPNGRDLGGVIPLGASIAGEPAETTSRRDATLTVGFNRAGGLPVTGWPAGSGYTHYRWRLDGGAWSEETAIHTPISLTNLANGPHYVEVVGKNDAGFYQDHADLGTNAAATVSRTWVVNTSLPGVRLNEVLAANASALNHFGSNPDAVELYNENDAPFDLSGFRLTDDPANPNKFVFPEGVIIPAEGYLVVYANNPDGSPGHHLGFNLAQEGEGLYLYETVERGGALVDSVVFGPQLTDLSIGRLAGGDWGLTLPSFGAANRAAPLGDQTRLRLNEWLAIGQAPFDTDFIELYNPDPLPVALGGLWLSDEIIGWPARHQVTPLSFIAGYGYLRFLADGNPEQGTTHLGFKLEALQSELALYLPDLTPIDMVWYQPQRANVSQGRSPNGGTNLVYFVSPTPGAPNPLVGGVLPYGGALVLNEVLANGAPDWLELYNGSTNTVALDDLSLSDDSLRPRRWVFAPGTQLAPGGFLQILCDGNNPATANNTGFGLKAGGGAVYLFDTPANGGGLLQAVIYGVQAASLSIGRVPDGSTNWVLCGPAPGGPNTAVPTLGNPALLRINEWLADAGPGNDDWFELFNGDTLPVALGGLYLTDDLNNRTLHQIAPLSFLGVGTNAWVRLVADGNPGAGADHVNFSLRSAGEALGLFGAGGALMDGVVFGPQAEGISEGRFPDGAAAIVPFPGTASPGEANYRWLTNVVINEVLTHSDQPFEDAIELRNLTAQDIDISNWWLSDDPRLPEKYQIPHPTILPANGFWVVYEGRLTNQNFAAMPFSLSSQGGTVVLSVSSNNALTGWRASQSFGAAEKGVSFGRHLTSVGKAVFVAMSARTFGADDPANVEEFRSGAGWPNAYPKVGPVVISEIMYHPPDLDTNDNVRDEFIELHNPTTVPVALYDLNFPANTWRLRNAVDFDFPPGTVLPPGGCLLVVSFDPALDPAALAAFRSAYGLGTNQAVLGPYSGKLANSDERIELKRPDTPVANDVPYIMVEAVRYYDSAPWPANADGRGPSLQRVHWSLFADDPANWVAAPPTPGSPPVTDSDGDGIPDAWEIAHGLDQGNLADAGEDPDQDGLTNLQEYLAGTDPKNPASVLKLNLPAARVTDGTNAVFQFLGVADKSYSIQYTDRLPGGWTNLIHFDPLPAGGFLLVTNQAPPGTAQRLYRVITPRSP